MKALRIVGAITLLTALCVYGMLTDLNGGDVIIISCIGGPLTCWLMERLFDFYDAWREDQ